MFGFAWGGGFHDRSEDVFLVMREEPFERYQEDVGAVDADEHVEQLCVLRPVGVEVVAEELVVVRREQHGIDAVLDS